MKIAVLSTHSGKWGDDGHIIKFFEWSKLKKSINLRDFDTVILDLVDLDQSSVDWKTFTTIFNIEVAETILRPGGRVIILGDPRFNMVYADKSYTSFLFWTGAEYKWYDIGGDTVEPEKWIEGSYFETYVSKIRRWNYALESFSKHDLLDKNTFYYRGILDGKVKLELERDKFATNRHSASLAFQIFWTLKLNSRDDKEVMRYGPIIFLPELSSVSHPDTLEMILRDVCRVNIATLEPDWAAEVIAPGQEPLDAAISDINAKVAGLNQSLEQKTHQRSDLRRITRLLYDGGTSLEVVVRDAFRDLGADVEDPVDGDNNEDGWLEFGEDEDTKLRGVLEVKSTAKPGIDNEGLRQLAEWKTRGIENRGKKYKGIMVASTMINEAPHERTNPFGDKFIESATLHEVAVITTTNLYKIYCLNKEGKLDVQAFWNDLFSTVGIFSIDNYIEPDKPSHK